MCAGQAVVLVADDQAHVVAQLELVQRHRAFGELDADAAVAGGPGRLDRLGTEVATAYHVR